MDTSILLLWISDSMVVAIGAFFKEIGAFFKEHLWPFIIMIEWMVFVETEIAKKIFFNRE
jgi:hypothetical protein